jgi:phage protein D
MTTKIAGVEIKIGGAALDPTYTASLLEVRVQNNLALPDTFLVRIADPGLAHVDQVPFDVGADVDISFEAADGASMKKVFTGQIAAVEPEFGEHGVVLAARGYDASHKLHRTSSNQTYQNMTYGDIAQKVISRAGLRAGTVDSAGGVQDFVQQSGETDWAFLSRLAKRIDFELVAEDGKVHFRKPVAGATVNLDWGQNLVSFRPRVTGVQQLDDVVVRGWDRKAKQAIQASAKNGTLGSTIGIKQSSLTSALGKGSVHITDRQVSTDDEAQALADGILSRLANSYVDGDGWCHGNPSLTAGSKVQIGGVGNRFGGTYTLSSTTHVYGGTTGYRTLFTISGRASGGLVDMLDGGRRRDRTWGAQLVVGIVTNNNDPDKVGRVRVKFPALGDDVESWWAPVIAPNAGKDRGQLMVPQVGDSVLVGFEQGDVRFPYVLGSLWNGTDTPGAVVATDGSYVLQSDKEIRLTSKGVIKVKSEKDMTVETDGKIQQKASGDYTVDGKSVTVKGSSSVSIEASSDLTIKGSSVTVQAQGSLSLKASGTVQVSGSQVMLG